MIHKLIINPCCISIKTLGLVMKWLKIFFSQLFVSHVHPVHWSLSTNASSNHINVEKVKSQCLPQPPNPAEAFQRSQRRHPDLQRPSSTYEKMAATPSTFSASLRLCHPKSCALRNSRAAQQRKSWIRPRRGSQKLAAPSERSTCGAPRRQRPSAARESRRRRQPPTVSQLPGTASPVLGICENRRVWVRSRPLAWEPQQWRFRGKFASGSMITVVGYLVENCWSWFFQCGVWSL